MTLFYCSQQFCYHDTAKPNGWWLRQIIIVAALMGVACSTQSESLVPHNHQQAAGCVLGDGFLRARLSGAINAELDWRNAGLECEGSMRPNHAGMRIRFRHWDAESKTHLVLLFGITGLQEGHSGTALPVNITLIRENSGDFFGTQGDDKCTIDTITQVPIEGVSQPHAWRVEARGFCIKPVRAVKGEGTVFISRFDFVGRVNVEPDESDDKPSGDVS